MSTGLFITSSGTEIGKTYVTALLCRQWRAAGVPVQALKPVLSGFEEADLEGCDAGQLLQALGVEVTPQSVAAIAPWRYRAALAPDMAARAEGREVDYEALVRFCRKALASHQGPVLIEGVGGVMAPVAEGRLVLHWIEALDLPALLVVGSYLGTISHTLTAVQALSAAGCPLKGIVVSESPDSPVPLDDTVKAIAAHLDAPVWALPRRAARDWRAQPDLAAWLNLM